MANRSHLPVTLVQPDTSWEDKTANHAHVRRLLAGATVPAGSLVVLPEMFDVGFSMNSAAAQDEPDGPTGRFLAALAGELRSTVVAGYVGRDESGRAVNQAGIFSPSGARVGRYTKTYPFSLAGEDRAYAAGSGAAVFELDGIRMAPAICYDLRFPELFRAARRLGAEVFVLIANWPAPRVEHWLTLARARAIENQAWVIAVNRTGRDPKLEYPGRSLVVDPKGQIVLDAGPAECVVQITIDVDHARQWREAFPVWRDVK